MKKKEFISKIAKRAGCTHETARNVLNAIKSAVDEQLTDGVPAKLPHFGTFTVKTRAARYISHPQTHEKIISKEKVYIHFKPLNNF
jgi:nucleoid DNA-binding protein